MLEIVGGDGAGVVRPARVITGITGGKEEGGLDGDTDEVEIGEGGIGVRTSVKVEQTYLEAGA